MATLLCFQTRSIMTILMVLVHDIDYAVVHYNRVFGIRGYERVKYDYSGTEMDSWAADVYRRHRDNFLSRSCSIL